MIPGNRLRDNTFMTSGARPTLDLVMLQVATVLAQRATCSKLAVGCVLTDKRGRILGSGYNGVPAGCDHCTVTSCPGANAPKGSDLCEAVHAESNALLVCHNMAAIHTAYVTHAPCLRCTKTFMNTVLTRIVFRHADQVEPAAKALWTRGFRSWEHFSADD